MPTSKSPQPKATPLRQKKPQVTPAPSALRAETVPRQTPPRPTYLPARPRQIAQLLLLLALPAALFFSYHPVISLGSLPSMNLELSLPLIWLVLFNLCSIPSFYQILRRCFSSHNSTQAPRPSLSRQEPAKNSPQSIQQKSAKNLSRLSPVQQPRLALLKLLLLLALPLYLALSCLWSANPLRGLLTVGVFWLIIGAIIGTTFLLYHTFAEKSIVFPGFLQFLATDQAHFRRLLCKITLGSAVIISVFCWLQCILDLAGLPRSATLLCAGCTAQVFGFPHPSGFAIEPQFMGGLLLAPALLALYLWQKRRNFSSALCAGFLCATLFLTFSRGAIYAFILALFVISVITLYLSLTSRNSNSRLNSSVAADDAHLRQRSTSRPRLLHTLAVPLVAFIFTLLAQGTFAAVGPTSDGFLAGVTKSIHHLSLGLVDLRPRTVQELPDNGVDNYADSPANFINTVETFATLASSSDTIAESANTNLTALTPATLAQSTNANPISLAEAPSPTFDGYAAISTDTRVHLTNIALETWTSSPAYLLAGTGLGGAGTVLFARYPELGSPKEIVQNQYASLLLETGLLGYLALAVSVVTLWVLLRRHIQRKPRHLSIPAIFLLALVAAYLATLCFFAGLPNALYIYLLPPLGFLLISPREEVK